MKMIVSYSAPFAALCLFGAVSSAFAHDEPVGEQAHETRGGYVLKPGEGETIGGARIIKASPKSGTRGGVMVLDRIPSGITTGVHIHTRGDEFFYIISGTGYATIGAQDVAIGPGAVVFASEGTRHAIAVDGSEDMEILAFMDEPGLAALFRDVHDYVSGGNRFTLDDCNVFGAKYNFVCITMGGKREQ